MAKKKQKMIECDTCINSRSVLSENGYHSVCKLSTKKEGHCIENGFCEYKKITIGDALEGIAKGNVSFEEGVDKASHLFALEYEIVSVEGLKLSDGTTVFEAESENEG